MPVLPLCSGIGMVLAALAMLYAAFLEIVRKNDIRDHGYIEQTLAGDNFNASKISMFAQVPEFAFIGGSEVFASISGRFWLFKQLFQPYKALNRNIGHIYKLQFC